MGRVPSKLPSIYTSPSPANRELSSTQIPSFGHFEVQSRKSYASAAPHFNGNYCEHPRMPRASSARVRVPTVGPNNYPVSSLRVPPWFQPRQFPNHRHVAIYL
ncbi:hypothetical protein OCU04_001358 [Sclerotinia nivalis]|uniref:Uncharacterized protein n=1 Tax=Sclerotinia nivalis TaxID=352851 RepID=A0A9X0B0C7_9HELO|nr:hypothetical protein OCU04_001358 [Sclerotinia nivalis]